MTIDEHLGESGPPPQQYEVEDDDGVWELVTVLPAQDYDGLRPIAIYRPAAKVEPPSD